MDTEGSENATGAANQQERLEAYIAGFVDGEGCFHVAIQRNSSTRLGLQLVPEFRVSQDVARVELLKLIQVTLGCGALRENHRSSTDHTFVLVVRRRADLLECILPFFDRNPLLSVKQQEFLTFAAIVRAMECGEHLTVAGFERLSSMARRMNGEGKYRRKGGTLEVASLSDSRILRDQMPGTHLQRQVSEGMVRSAWRHAEPGRNVLVTDRYCRCNKNVGPYPMQPQEI
jgi:hypothetical protein